MNKSNKSKTELILAIMHVLAWITFIGFLIATGAVIISYGVSWVNPEGAKNLYRGLDLYVLRATNFWHYTQSVSFIVTLSIMKATIAFHAIKILSKLNLKNPFTIDVSKRIEKISYLAGGTWIVSMLSNAHANFLLKQTEGMRVTFISTDFILMVGVLYIISQIFKKGVELQSENELTV